MGVLPFSPEKLCFVSPYLAVHVREPRRTNVHGEGFRFDRSSRAVGELDFPCLAHRDKGHLGVLSLG